MRTIKNSIVIQSTSNLVFESLMQAKAVKEWWNANQVIITKKINGYFIVQWGENMNDPDFVNVFEFIKIEAPKTIQLRFVDYISKAGELPFKADFALDFNISVINESSCTLEVTNSGFPEEKIADEIKDYNEKAFT